ncbi:ATP-binding protein [Rhodococcus sp. IEGM 1401]|jgi:serine/threonine-protein kinase RsbW|uniref:ATP-binding protein n=2 Tax=Rhodococcus TaxID=1827 RepID=A0ABU4B074_9NOCA|nr:MULTISPECIES: ATP-binding protein [Rhodococcus]KAA0925914.1 ATP-binding protein [Rhodococcus sp. ANT_H53B]MCZ4559765.1 ATP-binding protein [Rhodococcus sp. IEGM 1401]MDI6627315.1 ATP-binding protein [Rhodococcus sp. (in: high G+C Gram-positive bacteria)]MDI9920191.1 ATP-binding protein [Rhodococcus sp. IEGM 1372]MDI9926266.1 ATP-binding protein [Rhodococcus sp. IEGM 1341]
MAGVSKIEELERGSGAPVELRVRAEADQLPVVRAVAETLAVLSDFTLDDIADVKLVVDEVCSQLIKGSVTDAELSCTFAVSDSGIRIVVTSTLTSTSVPKKDSFGWHVLQTLTDAIELRADDAVEGEAGHTVAIDVVKRRSKV